MSFAALRFARLVLLGLIMAASLLFCAKASADLSLDASVDGAPTVWLYTVGPGAPTFERFGHTMLCETRGRASRCWDFGRWDAADTPKMVRASLAGRPAFGVTQVPLEATLDAFQVQDRRVEKQRLPLDADTHARLVGELERRTRDDYRYAYHPLTRNCATELRDLLDESTAGRLRNAARSTPTTSTSYRALAREGLRGKVLELTLVTLLVGRADDRAPDAWERAFLPSELSLLVERALAAPRELVLTERLPPLPQSQHAGDLVLGTLVLALAIWLIRARSEASWRKALGALGITVASVFLLRLLARLASNYPELALGPELLLVPPTDLALPWLPPSARRTYLRLRCASGGAALVLGYLARPPLVPFGFACISLAPMLAALLGAELRARRRAGG